MGVLRSNAGSLLGALPTLRSMPRARARSRNLSLMEWEPRRCLDDLESAPWRVLFLASTSFAPCGVYHREIGDGGHGIDPDDLGAARTSKLGKNFFCCNSARESNFTNICKVGRTPD